MILKSILAGILMIGGAYLVYNHYFNAPPEITIDSVLVKQAANLLTETFHTPIHIQSIVRLSEPGRRNLVLRLMLKDAHGKIPASIILKQSLPRKDGGNQEAFDRFAMDWAGLEFANTLKSSVPTVPLFYGGNKEHQFILLQDLGEPHVSLVDCLTKSDNAQAATESLERFMICLGQLHANSYQHTDEYLKMLQAINPTAKTKQDGHKEITIQLEYVLKTLGIPQTIHLQETISTVLKNATQQNPFTTFIHGDICPDNTFDNPSKKTLMLIDFEDGQVSNALLDATYLRMSMPTCSCAKSLPTQLIDSLEQLYRKQLMQKIPAAKNDNAYHEAYVHACAFWMLDSMCMIKDVLKKDNEWGVSFVRPRILSRLQAFIMVSNKYNKLPELKALDENVLQKLKVLWPDAQPLETFPAFMKKTK